MVPFPHGFQTARYAHKYRPDVLMLKPYAMWPAGTYRFDNIVLRRATRADYDEARRNRHSVKGFMKTE